jgi:serine/threonine protein kinase
MSRSFATFYNDFPNHTVLCKSREAMIYRVHNMYHTPASSTSIPNNICKVYEYTSDLQLEWEALTKLKNMKYVNRYVECAELNEAYTMITFPSFDMITKALFDEKRIRTDISNEINTLRYAQLLHVDVSSDNIMYDSIRDKYILIDFALLDTLADLEIMAKEYGVDQIAYKPGHLDPKGLTLDSDFYALEVAMSIMSTKFDIPLVFAPIGYPIIPSRRPERTIFGKREQSQSLSLSSSSPSPPLVGCDVSPRNPENR